MCKTKSIDWSCKHDIFLRNQDGSYTRMDEPYYKSELVGPGIWKILSAGDFSYLVAGEKEAVAIDTGYGAGNIREYLQTLTDVPVKNVFNTHDHFDHTANNGYFEKAFMAKETIPLATIPYKSFEGIDFIQDYERVAVEEGFIYDLGNRELEVFEIPDHTTGGIALLDKKGRFLFTGDEFMEMPMGKKLRVSLHTFVGYLEKLLARKNDFDYLGAGGGVFEVKMLEQFYACAKYILEGHRGIKEERKPFPQVKFENAPEGNIIYDRVLPHPGDGGPGKNKALEEETMLCMEYAGTKIIYNEQFI